MFRRLPTSLILIVLLSASCGCDDSGKELTSIAPATRSTPRPDRRTFAGKGGPSTRPDALSTGPTRSDLLRPSGTVVVTRSGVVIENADVTGTIDIQANNVTVRNFRIHDGGVRRYWAIQVFPGFSGAVIEDGEISMPNSDNGIAGQGYTASRIYFHDMAADCFRVGNDVTIQNCYVHNIGLGVGAHPDVIQSLGGFNVLVRGNNFDVDSRANSVIAHSGGVINHWLVEENWLNGGSYMIYSYADPTIRYLNNRIGHKMAYEVLYPVGREAILTNGVSWKNNVWDDTGQPVYP